ncbi:MAG: AbrB/MazE/SpoVT family DNA-binding domain-containing protein [Firmicutes bacterium]|nr:AbrB/MazE/SpoVT family DNA-binding domain-containing protein [Bacillota bacterium]
MSEIAKVSSKGQITLPARLRKRFDIRPGTYLRFIEEEHDFRVTLAPQGIGSLRGQVTVSGPQDFKKARHAAMEERINAKNPCD